LEDEERRGKKRRQEAANSPRKKSKGSIREQEANMSCPDRLSQWSQEVRSAFGHLSKPQVWGLVLWSAGIALSGTAGITQLSALLALVLDQQEQAVFQRLREWYLDAKHKSGKKRRELDVTTCFAPLLRWIVRLWGNENRQMVLVLDATTLGERWMILSISVVIRSCAIAVAWKVLGGHEKGSWRPHWEGLLKYLDGCIPAEWQVLVGRSRFVRSLAVSGNLHLWLASVLAHQSGGQSAGRR
jgi:hypothetical protein